MREKLIPSRMTTPVWRLALAHLVLLLPAAAWLLHGCGSETSEDTKLRLLVYTPPAGSGDPYQGVSWLRIAARGDGIDEADFSRYVRRIDGNADLGGIPFGTHQILLEGHPEDPASGQPIANVVLSWGLSNRVHIGSDSAERTIPIYLIPRNTHVPTARVPDAPGPSPFPTAIQEARVGATATLVDRGEVLVAGGAMLDAGKSWDDLPPFQTGTFVSTLELFVPRSGVFEAVGQGPGLELTHARAFHEAVLLADGRVAFLGGYAEINNQVQTVGTTEIFDPLTGKVSQGPDLDMPRARHTVTPIPGAKDLYLVVGGVDAAASKWAVWSPAEGVTKSGDLATGRWNHTATAVDRGTGAAPLLAVFVTGGENATGMASTIEVFQGPTLAFDAQAVQLLRPRTLHTATFVPSRGFLFLAGGFKNTEHSELEPLVDVVTVDDRGFAPVPNTFVLQTPRAAHTAVALADNTILLSGGMGLSGGKPVPLADGQVIFEAINPDQQRIEVKIGTTQQMPEARFFHAGVALETGQALLVGGATPGANGFTGPLAGLLYNP